MKKTPLWILCLLGALGCSEDSEATADGGAQDPADAMVSDAPTYYEHVQPLLQANCIGCHSEGGIGPFALETAEQVEPLAEAIASAIESGSMPPWGAARSEACEPRLPFQNDLSLSEDEIATVRAWVDGGAQMGRVEDSVTAEAPAAFELDTYDDELAPVSSFTTEGDSDDFICFVLDPQLEADDFVSALEVRPQNPLVVHHALVYVTDEVEEAEALAGDDGQFPCFGGVDVDGRLVAAWAPGGVPTVFPQQSGLPVKAESRFVVQIHYHPTGIAPETDSTAIRVKYTHSTPEYLAESALLGNFDSLDETEGLMAGMNDRGDSPEFFVPAGETDHKEKMFYTVPDTLNGERFPGVFIHSIANHMHYVGTDMVTKLIHAPDEAPCGTEELAPLDTCVDANCEGTDDLVQCAIDNCTADIAVLPGTCTSCLEARAEAGEDPFVSCITGFTAPQYDAIPAQPEEECLLHTPNWNFEWQRFYTFEGAIETLPFVKPGDRFEFECTFNNSQQNPFVRDALRERDMDGPVDVVLGDETLDEMCLMAVQFVYKNR